MSLNFETLHLGPLDNNTGLLWSAETLEAALIDVGFEPETVIARVRELGLTVRLLLNTHAHYDHVIGMRAAQKALGGDYWLHPADRPLLDHLSEQGAAFGFPPAQAPEVVHELSDGQHLMLGAESLAVIHTPGHSPGGVAFHAGGHAWVGDTLFAGSIGRTDLPGGSFEELQRSVHQRLFPLGDDTHVHPGHGPDTTIGRERIGNPFVGIHARLA